MPLNLSHRNSFTDNLKTISFEHYLITGKPLLVLPLPPPKHWQIKRERERNRDNKSFECVAWEMGGEGERVIVLLLCEGIIFVQNL